MPWLQIYEVEEELKMTIGKFNLEDLSKIGK